MGVYDEWAHDVAEHGLADAYKGIYFPLQYEVFHAALRLAWALGSSGVTALKAVNLAFDLASFGVLVVLLGRLGLPRAYALLYWLHPFFLSIFWLGYVDAQLGFLLLLTLLGLTYARTRLQYLAAGVPLGLAVLMKPQADMFVVMLVILTAAALVGRRLSVTPVSREFARRASLLLVAPAVFYAACSAWLALGGRSLTYLAQTNLPSELARLSPSLTANAPNIWYPVAERSREEGASIYTVIEPAVFNPVGAVLTILLLVAGTVLILRCSQLTPAAQALLVFTLPGIVGPMTLTHVHENHLFYGAIFVVATIPLVRDRRYALAIHALLLLWFVNLFGRYGMGLNSLSMSEPVRSLTAPYHDGLPGLIVAWSAIGSYLVFLIVLSRWMLARASTAATSPAESAPTFRERAVSGVQ
jgi:hypothetical protein